MKIVLKAPKYLHVETTNGIYVYGDNVQRFKVTTLKDLDNDCSISGNISIPISELFIDGAKIINEN